MDMSLFRTSFVSHKRSWSGRISARKVFSSVGYLVPGSNPRPRIFPHRKRSPFVCSSESSLDEAVPLKAARDSELLSTKIPSSIREKVETVVENQGYRVTVGDVSGRAGVTLNEAEDALQALAADSLGSLEVSTDGEVVYVLPNDFRSIIRAKSFWIRMEPITQRTLRGVATVGRIAFGVFFVALVITVWVVVIAASSSDKDRDQKSSSGGRVFFNVLDLFRIFSYMNYYSGPPRNPEELSFVESVFSYMFGDGNPNKEFEDRRWNVIGRYIRSRGGVVIAEELSPYLDLPKDIFNEEDSIVVDEGYMLPVLTRFQGEPLVSPDGNLAYIFPKLQSTGVASLSPTNWVQTVPYLQEAKWKFSKAPTGKLVAVLALAIANVIGVGILSNQFPTLLASAGMVTSPQVWFAGLVSLQMYAAAFFVVPLVRWLINRARNQSISIRNQLRLDSFQRLQRLTQRLRAKLDSARRLGKRKFIRKEDVIYDSAKDVTSFATKWEETEFDKRLN